MATRRSQLVFVMALCGASCRTPDGPADAGAAAGNRAAVVRAASVCIQAKVTRFRGSAQGLAQAAAAWSQGGTAAQRDAARAAFSTASDQWQELEQFQLGPAAPSTNPGGADLRDQIYAWPLFSACAVDEALVAQGYTDAARLLVNRRGLAAADALLWAEGDATVCGPSSTIVTSGSWAALSATERASRRRAYAAAVTQDVAVRAVALEQAWTGGFAAALAEPGPGSTPYGSAQQALNALSDASFYVDSVVKDLKLAPALGLRECAAPPCLDRLEAQGSRRAKQALAANVSALRELLLGCEAAPTAGFDDLLREVGAGSVASQLDSTLTDATNKLQAIEEDDLAAALQADRPSVQALYDSLKAVTTLLKGDFVMVLGISLPAALEGDND